MDLNMTKTRTFILICVMALVLGLSACGTMGTRISNADSSKASGANALPVNTSMGKHALVGISQVPVISVAEFTRPMATQAQNCAVKTDPSTPGVEGAISNSQGCVNSGSPEIIKAFKVVYELSGRQYAVELPENPGPFIQLQITSRPPQNSLPSDGVSVAGALPTAVVDQPTVTASAMAYPYVYFSGAIYRPVPIFIGARYRFGGGHRLGRGRRH
jgi:hypothetical protein